MMLNVFFCVTDFYVYHMSGAFMLTETMMPSYKSAQAYDFDFYYNI